MFLQLDSITVLLYHLHHKRASHTASLHPNNEARAVFSKGFVVVAIAGSMSHVPLVLPGEMVQYIWVTPVIKAQHTNLVLLCQ